MHRANNLRASGVVCLPSYEMPVEMKSWALVSSALQEENPNRPQSTAI
jgi:hypothetical protein